MTANAASGWRGLYDSLPDTAEKRAEECSLPVKIDRREDGHGQRRHAVARTVGNRLRQAGNHGGRLLKLSGTGVQPAGDDYVKTRLEFGSDSADRDSLMTAEEKEIISANK